MLDNSIWLELQNSKSGIPRMTPLTFACQLQCLPLILYILYQSPMSDCSKAPRGLSVLLRVACIFTDTTISPSPLLRQHPSRFVIRAGRNLPDKEFRYLRTVIVTAAVYWGLSSMLQTNVLTSLLDLPAPGRRQLLYFDLRLSRNLCFW